MNGETYNIELLANSAALNTYNDDNKFFRSDSNCVSNDYVYVTGSTESANTYTVNTYDDTGTSSGTLINVKFEQSEYLNSGYTGLTYTSLSNLLSDIGGRVVVAAKDVNLSAWIDNTLSNNDENKPFLRVSTRLGAALELQDSTVITGSSSSDFALSKIARSDLDVSASINFRQNGASEDSVIDLAYEKDLSFVKGIIQSPFDDEDINVQLKFSNNTTSITSPFSTCVETIDVPLELTMNLTFSAFGKLNNTAKWTTNLNDFDVNQTGSVIKKSTLTYNYLSNGIDSAHSIDTEVRYNSGSSRHQIKVQDKTIFEYGVINLTTVCDGEEGLAVEYTAPVITVENLQGQSYGPVTITESHLDDLKTAIEDNVDEGLGDNTWRYIPSGKDVSYLSTDPVTFPVSPDSNNSSQRTKKWVGNDKSPITINESGSVNGYLSMTAKSLTNQIEYTNVDYDLDYHLVQLNQSVDIEFNFEENTSEVGVTNAWKVDANGNPILESISIKNADTNNISDIWDKFTSTNVKVAATESSSEELGPEVEDSWELITSTTGTSGDVSHESLINQFEWGDDSSSLKLDLEDFSSITTEMTAPDSSSYLINIKIGSTSTELLVKLLAEIYLMPMPHFHQINIVLERKM